MVPTGSARTSGSAQELERARLILPSGPPSMRRFPATFSTSALPAALSVMVTGLASSAPTQA